MATKRQIYMRSETFERVKVKYPATGEEFIFAEKRSIEGEHFHCSISRVDELGEQSLAEYDLTGSVEIETLASGEFRLTGKTADSKPLLSE